MIRARIGCDWARERCEIVPGRGAGARVFGRGGAYGGAISRRFACVRARMCAREAKFLFLFYFLEDKLNYFFLD